MSNRAITTTPVGKAGSGSDGVPRPDAAVLDTAVPGLPSLAADGPLVLTRHGRDALVLLPLDARR